MDNISVIIRCRNEEQWVGHSIQSVIDNFDNPEIIIVNNNSTDESMNVVHMFKKGNFKGGGSYADIKVYNINSYTPGKSINFGISKCSNDYILILSAHSQIIECHFDKVKRYLDSNCVVGGRQIPIYKGKKIGRRYVWSNFIENGVKNYFSKSENRYFLHNAFSFYKKEILIKYPFNEELYSKEDRYWVNDRIDGGMNFYYDSASICYHHYTTTGATWRGIG